MTKKNSKPAPPKKLVSVRIPADLRRRVKTVAARDDKRLQDALAELIEEALKNRGA